ncbi:MAG: ABC transporter permease [Dehalococcoidia bacterium]|nr:ABC transporter permease [Dehalococcoidia bacterium]
MMLEYTIKRLLWIPVIILAVTFFTFLIGRLGPGDPISVAAGQIRDPQLLAEVRIEKGLDKPITIQYYKWLKGAVRADFGDSYIYQGYTISELIFPKMLVSAQLGFLALIVVFGLGIPLGLLAATLHNTWIDPFIVSTLLFFRAIPVIVIIPPLLWLFAVHWNLLPVGGWEGGLFNIYWLFDIIAIPILNPHVYLPVFALSIGGFGGVARLVRITALEVKDEPFIITARSKGLSESRVMYSHILPNSLLPLITVIGFALVGILEGAFFVEVLLGIPGIGRFTFEAVKSRDYDVILAMTVILSTMFIVINLIVELLYTKIDPRIQLGEDIGQ